MNGTDRFLIDTNILIYFLQGEEVAASFFKNVMDNKLKLGDALISATAIMHDAVLVSRNEKDFGKVDGLKFLNPYSAEKK